MRASENGTGYYPRSVPPAGVAASIPEEYSQAGDLGLPQILAIVRHYWKVSIAITLTVILGAVGLSMALPRSYVATATLMVNYASYVNKDPLAADQVQMLGSYVATQTELLQSPVVLLPVVRKFRLDQDPEYVAGARGPKGAMEDLAVENLARTVAVGQGRGGQLLYIQTTARASRKAAMIANGIADVYMEQERERLNDPAGERASRYSQQLAELRDKVAAAQEKVTQFRAQKGLTGVSSANVDVEMQTLAELEQKLVEAENTRRTIEARSIQTSGNSDAAMASGLVGALRKKLVEDEAELARLQGTFGPQHPRILELKSEMAATQQSLAEELRSLSANSGEELRSAIELEQKFRKAVADQRAVVMSVRQQQDEGAKLLLELDSAQAVYKRALDGYDQVLFASNAKDTNVSVISRAAPPAKAAKPNRLKLIAMGVAAGIGLGIALPLLYELLFHRRLRSREDFERALGISVLAELDALPTGSSAS